MTVEWKCSADELKCGSKAETSGLEIAISKTDESSVGMQLILDTDKNQGLSMKSGSMFCIWKEEQEPFKRSREIRIKLKIWLPTGKGSSFEN